MCSIASWRVIAALFTRMSIVDVRECKRFEMADLRGLGSALERSRGIWVRVPPLVLVLLLGEFERVSREGSGSG